MNRTKYVFSTTNAGPHAEGQILRLETAHLTPALSSLRGRRGRHAKHVFYRLKKWATVEEPPNRPTGHKFLAFRVQLGFTFRPRKDSPRTGVEPVNNLEMPNRFAALISP